MKPIITLVAFYLLCVSATFAQINYPDDTCWTSNYNDHAKNAVWRSQVVTDDSGSIIVLASGRLYDVLVKYSTEGRQLWIDSLGEDYNSYPVKLIVDNKNNIYVARSNWVIQKYNSFDSLLWQTDSHRGELNSIAVNIKGELAAGGTDKPNDKFVIKKFGKNGVLEWSRAYDLFPDDAESPVVAIDKDGNIYLTAQDDDSDISYAITIKYNQNGDYQWKSRINEIEFTYGQAIDLDLDGNVIVIAGGGDFFYDYLLFTFKYAPNGTLLWSDITNGGSDRDVGVGIDNFNNIYVCYPSDIYDSLLGKYIPSVGLTKYQAGGLIEWKKGYDKPEARYFVPDAMALDNGGHVIVASDAYLDQYPYDSVIFETLKFNSNGKIVWGQQFPIDTIQYSPNSVSIGKNGSIIVSASKTFPSGGELSTIDYCNCSNFQTVELHFPDSSSVCETTDPFLLTGGIPAGGTYSGDGVSNGVFDPEVAGLGIHQITYTYADRTGCSGSASEDVTVAVCTAVSNVGNDLSLSINPNPFINKTRIQFSLSQDSHIQFDLMDLDGGVIRTIAAGNFPTGTHNLEIDRNKLSSGVYLLQVKTEGQIETRKIVVQ